MKSLIGKLLLIAACTKLAGCELPAADFRVDPLDVPATADSFAPQIFTNDGRVSLSWLEATADGHALRYSRWENGAWSPASTVIEGGDWFANWADLPGVRPRAQGGWTAWWLQKSASGIYAYDVKLAFSKDGVAWSEPVSPHHDGTPTEHGFVTAFDLPEGGTGVVWLDGRNTQSADSHAHHGKGGMTLRHATFDGKGVQTGDMQLDGLVCDCCQTDSALSGDAVVVAYRNRTDAEIRDIHVQRFEQDEWLKPVRVHADNWKIDGCPVNGPGIAADGNTVAVAWFTAPEGEGEVRLAFSRDGGRSFDAPVRIDDGKPLGRVDLLMHPDHGAVVSWVEQGEAGARVQLRTVALNGETGESRVLASTDAGRASGFPRMVVLEDGSVLLAWTHVNGGKRSLQSARAWFP